LPLFKCAPPPADGVAGLIEWVTKAFESFRIAFRRLVPKTWIPAFAGMTGKSRTALSAVLQQPVTPGPDPGSMSKG
jgi:hypothetical protein